MGRVEAAQAVYSEQTEEVHMDERFGKLESDVAHIRSDISKMEGDIRELRADVKAIRVDINSLGKELRAEISAQGNDLRVEISAQGKELRVDIHSQGKEISSLRTELRVGFAVLLVAQALALGGVPAAIAKAFK